VNIEQQVIGRLGELIVRGEGVLKTHGCGTTHGEGWAPLFSADPSRAVNVRRRQPIGHFGTDELALTRHNDADIALAKPRLCQSYEVL